MINYRIWHSHNPSSSEPVLPQNSYLLVFVTDEEREKVYADTNINDTGVSHSYRNLFVHAGSYWEIQFCN